MESIQGRMLQSLRNVQAFVNDHAPMLGNVARSGARRRLDAILAELVAHTTEQEGRRLSSQGQTRELVALRVALRRDHLLPIVRIARANVPHAPELTSLQLPDKRISTERLVGEARAMGDIAHRHADLFVTAGMPTDFVAQLNAAADALLAAAAVRAAHVGQRIGATHGLARSLADGRRVVNVLDAFIRTAVQDEPVLLAEWRQVKRVQRHHNTR